MSSSEACRSPFFNRSTRRASGSAADAGDGDADSEVPLSKGRFRSAGPAPFLDAIASSERRLNPTISNGQEPAGQTSDTSQPHPHQEII
jgi:hypothetical protein